ncbi:signal transduction histidine kinase [Streptomyces sp. 2333.5]|nr:signal transduction histidine kinase [Streptomyces sp. 2333.5]SEE81926.1 Signal transduction histidine kinase [Streptomyces sp. 2314.4]SEF02533.1 Signal transduction histidine kinase [Streptomyces sp. 2112.2]
MPTAFPQGTQMSQEAQRSPGPQSSPGVAAVPTSARRRERDGGRHGRASFPESAADSAIRSRLVRLAAVPCLLVAVVCTAVAAFVVQAGGARLSGREWVILAGGLALVCVIVLTAGAAANAEARATVARYARLRQVCARSQSDLYDLLDRVRQGEWLQRREPDTALAPTGDTLDLLAHEVAAAGRAAESAVIDAVAIARSNASGSEQKVEVFVNLARRLQSLVHREIELLDELENQVEDPDLLKGLFHVDHLATRIRRHAENLAVLGGAISRRQWSRPVSMTEVLRSSIAEVEQYPRIKLVPPIEGTLRGHAVADVIHLLAELVENASIYSAPQTPVLLRAQLVTAGLAVEVEDRGLGMSADEQNRMNALLADPEHVDVAELLSDGRIGLFVVSSLARRHGIVVRLQSNIYGGVQAVLIVPQGLLGAEPADGERGGTDAAPTGSPDTVPALDHDSGYEGGYVAGYADDPDAGPARHARHDRHEPGAEGFPTVAIPRPAPAPDPALDLSSPGYDERTAEFPAPVPADPGPDSGAARRRLVHASGARTPEVPMADTRTPEPRPRELAPTDRPADPGPVMLPPAPPAVDDSARPRLPRRRKQTHLVPELRGDPILPSAARRTGPEPEHDPGLMAAFRRGFSLADDCYARDTGEHAIPPPPGGDTGSPAGNDLLYDRDHDAPMARPRGDDRNHGE